MHDPYFVEENSSENVHTQQKIRVEIEYTGGIKESFSCILYFLWYLKFSTVKHIDFII